MDMNRLIVSRHVPGRDDEEAVALCWVASSPSNLNAMQ